MVHPQQKYQERRRTAEPANTLWQLLTAEQKMAFYRLQGYGYRLLFIRQMFSGPLAIVAQQDELATIDCTGDINLAPSIVIRA